MVKRIVFALIFLATGSELYGAETQYIRDQLFVPLRSGQTNQHRIVHKGLVSGTAVTVLELNEDKSYSRVRTQRGTEGWIQTQYLSPEPAGRDLYEAASKQLEQLKLKNSDLQKKFNALNATQRDTAKKLSNTTSSSKEIAQELERVKAISANALQLNEDNQRLLQENQMLKNELEVVNTDNQRLTDNEENDAFLNGAFAVLIGVMITLVVPRLWPKKATEWA